MQRRGLLPTKGWLASLIVLVMLLPILAVSGQAPLGAKEPVAESKKWWESTNMDSDRDGIHDAIWMAVAGMSGGGWVDDAGTISVIVDFDHTPTEMDERLLEREVGFDVEWRYHLIDSIAGRVEVAYLTKLTNVEGVVLIELDGRLEVQMSEVLDLHGIPDVWEDTGYTGAGSVVAIIDTGIDGDHEGLNDLDDINETFDPKVIGFYDAVNNSELVNGTEVHPYDDNGHGSHCAGITAGTGAPDYEYIGVAPQAQLVGVKVLDAGGSGSFATVMAGMEWTVDYRHAFNIRAASMSLGGPGAIEWTSSEEESVNRMGNEMMREGVALFIAAGNNAVSAQIGTPGSAEDVITVGALDKDTGIAVYSSQGPTEEGRIKPNIAFTGSNVMSVDFNTSTGYTSKSGTSMATPGAAGVAALMYQANPDISPFDVRNIMQETATYRQCHYMLKNEPCIDDLVPKVRQNNVYGHGHVNSHPSVFEAANRTYGLDPNLNVTLMSEAGYDDKVHIDRGGTISFGLQGEPVEVQWRTWDMRDTWMDHSEFDAGDSSVTVTHEMIIDRLAELPGVDIEGNHTIIVRSIRGENASANRVVHMHIMGLTAIEQEASSTGATLILILATLSTILLLFVVFLLTMLHRTADKGLAGLLNRPDKVRMIPPEGTAGASFNELEVTSAVITIDSANLTVAELKEELVARGLATGGKKADLVARLDAYRH